MMTPTITQIVMSNVVVVNFNHSVLLYWFINICHVIWILSLSVLLCIINSFSDKRPVSIEVTQRKQHVRIRENAKKKNFSQCNAGKNTSSAKTLKVTGISIQ